MDTIYLGIHRPNWLWDPQFTGTPVFVSDYTLRDRKGAFPRAVTTYAVDSGAFSELSRKPENGGGVWTTTPEEYVARLRRYWTELGPFDWAAQQDSMCEPFILDNVLAATGHRPTVEDHQRATVENYLRLRELAPELPIVPTIQGWDLADYLRCVQMYAQAGVNLAELPRVGIGSVCRRQATSEIEAIVRTLAGMGIKIHGFGVKLKGLERIAHLILSADSMAWSYDERFKDGTCCTGPSGCRNCPAAALRWHKKALRVAEQDGQQLSFDDLLCA
jgi:hypothetical protein